MTNCPRLTSWLAPLLAAVGLAACSGTHEPARVATTVAQGIVAPTTNVPAMLGVSIDSLRHRLGAAQPLPTGFKEYQVALASASGPDSVAAFRTGGLVVVASYDAHTRRVRDLLLFGHHEDSLMGRASLRADAAEYLVMPVFQAANTSRLLGLRVISTK